VKKSRTVRPLPTLRGEGIMYSNRLFVVRPSVRCSTVNTYVRRRGVSSLSKRISMKLGTCSLLSTMFVWRIKTLKYSSREWAPQGQYWIEYLYLLLVTPPYMAAANFVVITNGGGCALTGTADIDQ